MHIFNRSSEAEIEISVFAIVVRAISRELVRKLGTSEKKVSRHCRYLFLLRFIIGSFSFLLAGLPAGHSDK